MDVTAPSSQPVVRQRIHGGLVGAYEAVARNAAGEGVPVLCTVAATTLNGQPVRAASLRDLRPVAAPRGPSDARSSSDWSGRSAWTAWACWPAASPTTSNNLLAGRAGQRRAAPRHAAGRQPARESRTTSSTRRAPRRHADPGRCSPTPAGANPGRREPVDVADLMGELRVLLAATLSKKARIDVDVQAGSVVLGNRATLSQVAMNLLSNASDALGRRGGRDRGGGRAPSPRSTRAGTAAVGATVRPGDWVLLTVRDTGTGMDEATRGRVFEPFFSTKERGHGLGMAACLGIVSAHGGAVLVESEPGQGSCFSVLLPAATGEEATAGKAAPPRASRAPGKVLIIDDEPLVRAQLRRSLEPARLHGGRGGERPRRPGRAGQDPLPTSSSWT